ncbi:hypothetical protein [Enterococcus sp. LJL90]
MNRHIYCLTYNDEFGIQIEALDVKSVSTKEIILSEKSKIFSNNRVPYYHQYRVQQTSDSYLVWCLDRENIPKMKELFLRELEKDLRYYQLQVNELEKAIQKTKTLTLDNWIMRE